MKTALAIAAAAALAGPALADTAGETLFGRHCAVCHGSSGEGSGPMAGVLLIKPADLTALEAANGGLFPTARVIARIDGQDPLVSHGSPMPVYGPYFEGPAMSITLEDGERVRTSAPVALLVEHLKQLQD